MKSLLGRLLIFIEPMFTEFDLWALMFVTHYKRHCVDLSDVTLVDEHNNAINTDDANLVIPSNVAMLVAPPGGQLWNQQKSAIPVTSPGDQIWNKS